MQGLTSESDSNTFFAGEETQGHLSFYFFSLTTDINRASKNPRVPAAQPGSDKHDDDYVLGVRVPFLLLLAVSRSPFVSSQWLL